MKRGTMLGMAIVLTVLVVAWVISCGGGGSSSSSDFSGMTKTFNLGSWAPEMPIKAGDTSSLVFSVNLGMDLPGGPYTYLILDLEENLSGLTFTPGVSPAGLSAAAVPLGGQPVFVTIYVASVDAANPCATGIQYGPFRVALDSSNQPESVTLETAEATQATLDIINIGAFSVCVEVQSPIAANASQDDATFSICDESIADIAGTWIGDYSCGGNCPESGEIELWITQASDTPGYANYSDDGAAFYMGNVCGYTFSFDGGTDIYDENGIFVMDPSGLTATKTSTYQDIIGPCSGSCLDTLHRPGVGD